MSEQILTPYLTVSDARAAIEFYRAVFDAQVVEGEFYEMDDGRVGHVTLRLGGANLFVSEEFPEMEVVSPDTLGGCTAAIIVQVDDADATYALAVEHGAVGQRPPEDQHGGRSGWIKDPWGHRWSPTGPASGSEG